MLLVLANGPGRWIIAKRLITEYRFVGRNTLPKVPPTKGARVVVVVQEAPVTLRDKTTLRRRVDKLGGLVVWLKPLAKGMEVTIQEPTAQEAEPDSDERSVAELMALVGLKR